MTHQTGWEPNESNDNTDWHPVEGVEYANRRFLNGYTLWVRAPERIRIPRQTPLSPDTIRKLQSDRLFTRPPLGSDFIEKPKYWLWQVFDQHNVEVAGGKTAGNQNLHALYAADSFAGGDTTLYERILHGRKA